MHKNISSKLRKLITRGTDSALDHRNPRENYRTSTSPILTASPARSSSDSSTRCNSSSTAVQGEDGSAHPSSQSGLHITAAFSSSTSLEASLHQSLSTSSIASGSDLSHLASSMEHQYHGREGTSSIARDVPKFVTAVGSLEDALNLKRESFTNSYLLAHFEEHQQEQVRGRLLEVIKTVKEILSYHKGMHSTAVLNAIHKLSKAFDGESSGEERWDENWYQNLRAALNGLIESFNTSVQAYTQGEHEQYRERELPPHAHAHAHNGHHLTARSMTATTGSSSSSSGRGSITNLIKSKGMSKSHENLSSTVLDGARQDVSEEFVDVLDQAMMSRFNAIDMTMSHCKLRSKYLKTVITYLNKRAQMETDFYRHMHKLAKNTQEALREMDADSEATLPLLGLFIDSVEADVHFAKMSHMTCNFEVHQKLTEPLLKMDQSNEKMRKELKENWAKEQKKMNEAKAALNSSSQKYVSLGHEIVKATQVVHEGPPHKQEKKRKELTDLWTRFGEAEQTYRRLVRQTNACQYQVHMAQKSILCAFRRMVIDSDHALRSDFEEYFHIQRRFYQLFPEPRQKLANDTHGFVPGRQFYCYVQNYPEVQEELQDYYFEDFNIEERLNPTQYVASPSEPDKAIPFPRQMETAEQSPTSNGHVSALESVDGSSVSLPPEVPTRREPVAVNDSEGGIPHPSTRPRRHRRQSRERPQSFYGRSSPKQLKEAGIWKGAVTNLTNARGYGGASSVSDLRQLADAHDSSITPTVKMSRNAETHKFHKLEAPARCRECDTQVYFDGVECSTCELVAHQRCLGSLSITCGTKLLKRKLYTFGADLQRHLESTQRNIPIIVTKCINEIEDRALDVQGLYRLSGAKSRMERICQLFEAVADRVDLSEQNPHLVASVLKLYLRKLPEPLMTFALYDEFISITRESLSVLPMKDGQQSEEGRELLKRLRATLSQLPLENYMTLALIIYHLKRVASCSDKNLMSESNLSIVFGPNLLKSRGSQSSIAALTDMTHQAKLVEIMIHHADKVFTTTEEEVWQHVTKEEVVEVTKEAYIPVEHQQQSSLLHLDSFDDDEMDTLPNTPPERRLSILCDLDAIMLTISGEDEVLVPPHLFSLGARRASEPNLLEPASSIFLTQDLPRRGSGCKSSLSMQRQLTPVGEEQANAVSTSPKKVDPSGVAETHSEEAVLTMSDNDNDSECSDDELQTCSLASPESLPMINHSEDDASHFGSTYSLPAFTKRNVTPSGGELEYSGSLDRKQRFRIAQRWARMQSRHSGLVTATDSSPTDQPITGRRSGGLEQNCSSNNSAHKPSETRSLEADEFDGSPEDSDKVVKRKLTAEMEPERKKMGSPVRGDFLSCDASVSSSSPGREARQAVKAIGSLDCSAQTESSQDEEQSKEVVLGDADPVHASNFKRDDISRIGMRHTFPLRNKSKSQRKIPPYVGRLSASPLSFSGYEQTSWSHSNSLLEETRAIPTCTKEGVEAVTDRGRRNYSESCEKDSLSENSVFSSYHNPDSGNESVVTTDIRGSSSEGDLLQDDPHKSLTAASSIDDGDDGIGISPLVNCGRIFDLQVPTDACVSRQEEPMIADDAEVQVPHNDTLSDTSLDIRLFSSISVEGSSDKHKSSTDESLPEDVLVDDAVFAGEDDVLEEPVVPAEEGVEGSDADTMITAEASLTDRSLSGSQEGQKKISSGSTPETALFSSGVSEPHSEATRKSSDIQPHTLERADLFQDSFSEADKVSYGSIGVLSSRGSLNVRQDQLKSGMRQRPASEADLLADGLKSWGSVPVNQRIKEWNKWGERLREKRDDRSQRKAERRRMVQSMYECDNLDVPPVDVYTGRSLDDSSCLVGNADAISDSSRTPRYNQTVEVHVRRRSSSGSPSNPPSC